jgi:hydrogenase expression/formation protein HypD
VCAVTGSSQYQPIVEKFRTPIVVTGFEPVDLIIGIYRCILQLERGEHKLENQYQRVVLESGNIEALKIANEVFEVADRAWRGLGVLPKSGFALKAKYGQFDANLKFDLVKKSSELHGECMASLILKGVKKPRECGAFGKLCTPENPLGAPMVSSEGACAAYFHYTDI